MKFSHHALKSALSASPGNDKSAPSGTGAGGAARPAAQPVHGGSPLHTNTIMAASVVHTSAFVPGNGGSSAQTLRRANGSPITVPYPYLNPTGTASNSFVSGPTSSAAFGFGGPTASSSTSFDFGGFGSPAPAPARGGFRYGDFGSPAPAPAAGGGFRFGGFGSPAPAPAAGGGFRFGGYGSPAPAPAGGGFRFGGFGSPAPAPAGGELFGSPAPAPSGGNFLGQSAAAAGPSSSAGDSFGSPGTSGFGFERKNSWENSDSGFGGSAAAPIASSQCYFSPGSLLRPTSLSDYEAKLDAFVRGGDHLFSFMPLLVWYPQESRWIDAFLVNLPRDHRAGVELYILQEQHHLFVAPYAPRYNLNPDPSVVRHALHRNFSLDWMSN